MSIYYDPKPGKISACVDITEYNKIIWQINGAVGLNPEQRALLKLLATRFIEFKYEKLADYYSSTDADMQKWLEKLRCVIVDSNSAIQNGYLKYKESYTNLIEGIINEK